MYILMICLTLSAPMGPAATKKTVTLGPNVLVEIEGTKRRVVVEAVVCLNKGPLEGLLTRKMTKEHEYILAGDFDARHLHAALLLAGAKAGKTVQFLPKYSPASGSRIGIQLRYDKAGKTITIPARDWIKDHKTGKTLDIDWVFGGSKEVPHPEGAGKPAYYVANHGDVVCVCNMDSAMLDLPIESPKKFDIRTYEAATVAIPPIGTKVAVIFEVVEEKGGR
ncbi:MAG: hypothetical protein EBV06_08095 [Planctomycetia bacterium]|nr:hypothetical protein [Planctomycetia bacterium]